MQLCTVVEMKNSECDEKAEDQDADTLDLLRFVHQYSLRVLQVEFNHHTIIDGAIHMHEGIYW